MFEPFQQKEWETLSLMKHALELMKEKKGKDEKDGVVGSTAHGLPATREEEEETGVPSTSTEGGTEDIRLRSIRSRLWSRTSVFRERALRFLKKPSSEALVPSETVDTPSADSSSPTFSMDDQPEAPSSASSPAPTATSSATTSPGDFDYSPLSLLWSFVPFQRVWRSAWLLLMKTAQQEYDLRPYGMGVVVDFGWARQRT